MTRLEALKSATFAESILLDAVNGQADRDEMAAALVHVQRLHKKLRELADKENDKMAIEFFMPMIPPTVTHQEKQVCVVNGKPLFYEPARLKAARNRLRDSLAAHRPREPLEGALRLVTKWCFPRGRHTDGEYRTTRPDTDNLQKLLKDVMTGLHFWRDDAQVASEIVEKFWAELPGIYIRIETV